MVQQFGGGQVRTHHAILLQCLSYSFQQHPVLLSGAWVWAGLWFFTFFYHRQATKTTPRLPPPHRRGSLWRYPLASRANNAHSRKASVRCYIRCGPCYWWRLGTLRAFTRQTTVRPPPSNHDSLMCSYVLLGLGVHHFRVLSEKRTSLLGCLSPIIKPDSRFLSLIRESERADAAANDLRELSVAAYTAFVPWGAVLGWYILHRAPKLCSRTPNNTCIVAFNAIGENHCICEES